MNTSDLRRFGGISRLFGAEGLENLQNAHVCVVGVGGVGSWAAEALARSAVGTITLIDADTVAMSNTNRQLPAMDGNWDEKKIEVLARRFRAINPEADIRTIDAFVDETNYESYLSDADIILDCIDSMKAKVGLVAWAKRNAKTIIVSAGAGGRIDPTRVCVADMADVKGDALIAALRTKLRREHGFPKATGEKRAPRFGIETVYSDEQKRETQDGAEGFGVFVGVTATFGMMMSARAVQKIVSSVR